MGKQNYISANYEQFLYTVSRIQTSYVYSEQILLSVVPQMRHCFLTVKLRFKNNVKVKYTCKFHTNLVYLQYFIYISKVLYTMYNNLFRENYKESTVKYFSMQHLLLLQIVENSLLKLLQFLYFVKQEKHIKVKYYCIH